MKELHYRERKRVFRELVKRLKSFGFSQSVIAENIGYSTQSTVSIMANAENGKYPPRHRLALLVEFCEKIGVSADV